MDLILKYFMNAYHTWILYHSSILERLPYIDLIPLKYFRTSTIHGSNTQVFYERLPYMDIILKYFMNVYHTWI